MLITDAKQCVKVFNDWLPHPLALLYFSPPPINTAPQVFVEGPFESALVVGANLK